jgi:hypothetical protein
MAIDTLKIARRLREAGFSEPQADAVVAAVQEGGEGADFATKADLAALAAELRAEIAALRAELKAEISQLRAELKADISQLRAELKADIAQLRAEIGSVRAEGKGSIEAAKSELLNRMFQMILSAVLINIVAMAGLMFAFAKLLGH